MLQKLSSAYDKSKYLKAADLDRERKFRIKTITEEVIGADRDKEEKPVVWFHNDKRGLVLNKVNSRVIRGAFGDAFDGWVDKIIVIYPAMVDFRGQMVPALRVRPLPPKQAAAAATSRPASGNGGAAVVPPKAAPVADPELESDPVVSDPSWTDDEIGF